MGGAGVSPAFGLAGGMIETPWIPCEEWIVLIGRDQASLGRVVFHVAELLGEVVIAADDAIEVFVLPKRAGGAAGFEDCVGGKTLDAVHEFAEAEPLGVGFWERGEQEMDVVGHDDRGADVHSLIVKMQACVEDNLAFGGGEFALEDAEGDEVGSAAALEMREAAEGNLEVLCNGEVSA